MTEIIRGVDFSDFYLTLIRVLKLIDIFKDKNKNLLTKKRIIMFDFYMRFPFMTEEEREKQNFDEKYAFYFWKPNYTLYDAVLSILFSKGFILCKDECYLICPRGEEVLKNINCEYMEILTETGDYIINTVLKMSDKRVEEDILSKSNYGREGIN